jgi:hypothetical protein
MAANNLNHLLRLALLTEELYGRALEEEDLLEEGTPEHAAARLILSHQAAHAAQLRGLGASVQGPAPGEADFTAGGTSAPGEGPFEEPLAEIDDFLKVAQLLEDLAVRAYQGQLEAMRGNPGAYAVLLRMHAVKARHAAQIRRLRERVSYAFLKPWITEVDPGDDFWDDPAPSGMSQIDVAELVYGAPTPDAQAATTGEDNRVQGPVTFQPTEDAYTEAYDEPMTAAQVEAVLTLFLP